MRRALVLSITALISACEGAGSAIESPTTVASSSPSSAGVPAPTNVRFGLGAAPSRARLASWDTDIGAEGEGLPAGRGTVAEGKTIYTQQCALCHGNEGQGIHPAFPALIGRPAAGESFAFATDPNIPRTIGNYWSHAPSLFDYIRRAMPLMTPGSLSDDQTYAVTAYLLAANGVIPETTTLDAASLRAVKMPARDRFVPDDRASGPGVR